MYSPRLPTCALCDAGVSLEEAFSILLLCLNLLDRPSASCCLSRPLSTLLATALSGMVCLTLHMSEGKKAATPINQQKRLSILSRVGF